MKILIATDGSAPAQAAGALLATLPLPRETELQAVTVVPDSPSWSEIVAEHLTDNPSLIEEVEEENRKRAERWLSEAAAPFREHDIAVTTAIRRGHAGSEILQAACEMGAEMIVVGSRGRTGLAAILLGSTAEYVAKHAACSVLVTRAAGAAVRRILLATDGSEHSRRAMERLQDLPLPRTAAVTVLHVTESFFAFPGLLPSMREEFERTVREIRREQRQNAALLVEGTCRFLKAAGYAAAPAVGTGKPAEEILAAAREVATDLIVVGARGLSPTREFLLGSVSGRILRYAPCSVLLAR